MRFYVLTLFIFSNLTSFAFGQKKQKECLWTKDQKVITQVEAIAKMQENYKDWDSACTIKKPSYEEMQKCWCKANNKVL